MKIEETPFLPTGQLGNIFQLENKTSQPELQYIELCSSC